MTQGGHGSRALAHGGPEGGDFHGARLQQQDRTDLLAQQRALRVQEQRVLRAQRGSLRAAHDACPR